MGTDEHKGKKGFLLGLGALLLPVALGAAELQEHPGFAPHDPSTDPIPGMVLDRPPEAEAPPVEERLLDDALARGLYGETPVSPETGHPGFDPHDPDTDPAELRAAAPAHPGFDPHDADTDPEALRGPPGAPALPEVSDSIESELEEPEVPVPGRSYAKAEPLPLPGLGGAPRAPGRIPRAGLGGTAPRLPPDVFARAVRQQASHVVLAGW